MASEEPKFALALKEGAFEVRDYPALIVAEVTVTGYQQQASSAGFRTLADYIFGGNTSAKRIAMTVPMTKARTGQKIAMTAPVTLFGASGEWVVRFTMPAGLTLAYLPQPDDPRCTSRRYRPRALRWPSFPAWQVRQVSWRKRLSYGISSRRITSRLRAPCRRPVSTHPGLPGLCAETRS